MVRLGSNFCFQRCSEKTNWRLSISLENYIRNLTKTKDVSNATLVTLLTKFEYISIIFLMCLLFTLSTLLLPLLYWTSIFNVSISDIKHTLGADILCISVFKCLSLIFKHTLCTGIYCISVFNDNCHSKHLLVTSIVGICKGINHNSLWSRVELLLLFSFYSVIFQTQQFQYVVTLTIKKSFVIAISRYLS